MKIKSQASIAVPEDIKAFSIKGRKVSVTGPRGTLTKDLSHLQLDFRVDKKHRTISAIRWFGNKTEIACLNTALSHIRNMMKGVTVGFRYKLRFASAHFPINVSVTGQNVEIRNFLGEKRVRRQAIPESVKVYRTDPAKTKDELVLEGNDVELVSQQAAVMHQLCAVKNKDIRKFLDGIYVQTKSTVVGSD